MKKYNLTFWQRLELIPVRLLWLMHDSKTRISWHELKKGFEKHECKFTIPHKKYGYDFLKCEHEGCYTMIPKED